MKSSLKAIQVSLTVFFFSLFLQPLVSAQSSDERPSVGLVLSGGGALGMAHVGVIKVMEESGLRPDFITGVSMGSIVGGMYSIGYGADSLYKILKSMNWNAVLSNKIPENKIIFPEKKNFYNSIISLPLSFSKVKLPSGMINGQLIENSLSFYTWPAADINDFSKFPIPFMCVGTDLITGKKVDLKTGCLPDAMRASMAVPTLFTPIKIDTALLIDGGFLRNFAASEVREMGADIVIGSYVGAYRYTEEKLQSVSEIIKQLAFSMSIKDFEEEKKLADLVIMPEIKDLSATDFDNVDTIIQRGYKATLPYRDYFKKLADSLNKYSLQNPIENILDKQYYSFDRIEINGNNIYSDLQILDVLDIEPGQQTDKYLLSSRIELLYGKAWFEKVKYRIVPRNDSLILCIDCIERAKAMLYGSVYFDNTLGTGIVLRASLKNLLTLGSVIDLDSYLGEYFRGRTTFLQYIDRNQKVGLSAEFYTDNTLIPVLDLMGETGRVISRNFTAGLNINRRLGLNNFMNISADYENLNLLPDYVSEVNLKNISYKYFTATYDYRVNTLNSKYFPDRGMILNLSAGTSKLLSANIKTESEKTDFKNDSPGNFAFNMFFTLSGNFKHYFTSVDRWTLSISGDVLFISDCDSITGHNNFFLLGGTESVNRRSIPMIGFQTNEIPVKKLAGIGTELDMELFKDFHISIMANVFAAQEADRENGYSFLAGYGLGVGYMSIIGPLKAGMMLGQYNNEEEYFKKIKSYISLGFNF
ncbi:MAG: patatin-like phospholipase family protein [Bacteroidales bacterium]|nr:patatin-like phospholipase family protein [Bacteroidales bacterium]